MIRDAVFGDLEYDFGWTRYTTIAFCGKEAEIVFIVDGDEGFLDKQYAAYKAFMEHWGSIQQSILQPVLDYYNQNYDPGLDSSCPVLQTTGQLLEAIRLIGITVPHLERPEGRYIGLTFDCRWDPENGLGILLRNEKLDRIGFQDVAL